MKKLKTITGGVLIVLNKAILTILIFLLIIISFILIIYK
jgi:hypothetical protein